MARNPQTFAKRARELALKERRELKREKKAEAAARKAEALAETAGGEDAAPEAPEQTD